MERKAIFIRVPVDTAKRWEDAYANSYPQHRLSFTAWLIGIIDKALQK